MRARLLKGGPGLASAAARGEPPLADDRRHPTPPSGCLAASERLIATHETAALAPAKQQPAAAPGHKSRACISVCRGWGVCVLPE